MHTCSAHDLLLGYPGTQVPPGYRVLRRTASHSAPPAAGWSVTVHPVFSVDAVVAALQYNRISNYCSVWCEDRHWRDLRTR
eukprot:2204250-Rhodomonas_salina.1